MPSDRSYDVAVIGSGPGGYAAALTAARRGARVALIEREHWGGVCLNVGCIPTKAWLAVAALAQHLQRARQFGIRLDGFAVDFSAVRARAGGVVERLRRGLVDLLRLEGVELLSGEAAFDGPGRLILRQEGKTERLDARRIVVATGARPIAGPWAFDEQRVLSYRGLLSLDRLPSSLLIIGGGAIGCEFASCFSAFGTPVTLVERESRVLPAEDPDAARYLQRRLERGGVTVKTGTDVERLAAGPEGVEARLADGTSLAVERCLVAIGQRPNLDTLQLAAGGIAHGAGITVDAFCRTSQPHVAAIGDCVEGHGFAHWASAEGAAAVRGLLGDPPETITPLDVPRCVFTEPEIAQIGPLEFQLAEPVRVSRIAFGALGKSHCDDELEGFVKLLVDPATDRIRAATVVGHQASTLIHQAVVAIRHGLTAKQLARTITAHPTLSESLTEAAASLYGESLVVSSRPASRRAAKVA